MNTDRKALVVEKITGACIAFTILSKGFEESAHFEHYPLRVGFIFFAGLFVLAGALLYGRIEQRIHHFAAIFHVLEGLVEILCATLFLVRGSRWLPVFLFFIGAMYVFIGAIQFFCRHNDPQATMLRLKPYLGGAFIIFAAAVSAVNALTSRSRVVFIMTAFVVGIGLFLVFWRKPLPKLQLSGKLYDKKERRRTDPPAVAGTDRDGDSIP
jgi:hypothetical protein